MKSIRAANGDTCVLNSAGVMSHRTDSSGRPARHRNCAVCLMYASAADPHAAAEAARVRSTRNRLLGPQVGRNIARTVRA